MDKETHQAGDRIALLIIDLINDLELTEPPRGSTRPRPQATLFSD